jgi:MazG family protein
MIQPNQDPNRQQKLQAFDRLLTIMDELRLNCPWDKKQTLESLRHLTIEETYELSDAIIENDRPEIKKELGDIMLHLVFYARIASETNDFNIADVLEGIAEKLIRRHPHIYADTDADSAEKVEQNWEQIKLKEKGNKGVLSGVPKSLPAMVKAHRIQEKVSSVGFDWDNAQQVWDKVREEWEELEVETREKEVDQEKVMEEMGDVLFSMVNLSRFINVNPEEALERTNKKFIKRFTYIEERAKAKGKQVHELSLEEMEALWGEAKKHNKG